MSQFKLRINVDNTAFRNSNEDIQTHEIARLLRKIADEIDNETMSEDDFYSFHNNIRDINGNFVGFYTGE